MRNRGVFKRSASSLLPVVMVCDVKGKPKKGPKLTTGKNIDVSQWRQLEKT